MQKCERVRFNMVFIDDKLIVMGKSKCLACLNEENYVGTTLLHLKLAILLEADLKLLAASS